MSRPPFYNQTVNAYTSSFSPNTLHAYNTELTQYFMRYLVQDVLSVYKVTMPETWDVNYVLYTLFCRGYFAVVETDKFGVIAQQCGLGGRNVFYQPSYATITNPLLTGILRPQIGTQCALVKFQPDYGNISDIVYYYATQMALVYEALVTNLLTGILRPQIGTQCALVKFQPDYGNISDIVYYYATQMALVYEALVTNLQAAKIAWVYFTSDKRGAETFKKLIDRIMGGDIAVAVDSDLFDQARGEPRWTLFDNELKSNFIGAELTKQMRDLRADFHTEIGIPTANTEKRERLIVDEVNSNNIETYSRPALWLEEIERGCKTARELFGIPLKFEWRYPPQTKGGERIAESDPVNHGALDV